VRGSASSSTTTPRLLPTSLVGSYPQPDWLIDRVRLRELGVPRVRVPEIWRVEPDLLAEAKDDATALVIAQQERLGLDVITDGEVRRESYSNYFANTLGGIDAERRGELARATGGSTDVPLFSGPARRTRAVGVEDVRFLRARTDRVIKATLPGPFSISEQAETSHYADREGLALDLADAVNAEVRELFAAGADVVQLDEPWMERWPERSKVYGTKVLNRALDGIEGTIAIHLCFGYGALVSDKRSSYRFFEELADTPIAQVSVEAAQPNLLLSQLAGLSDKTIILGVLDLADESVESLATVAARIEAALAYVAPERLAVAPDCGLKYLSREVANAKLTAMVEGAALVRAKLAG
jgi:5-methyltetrahydropteroyltriglutamate--homocysteine methyltransferase